MSALLTVVSALMVAVRTTWVATNVSVTMATSRPHQGHRALTLMSVLITMGSVRVSARIPQDPSSVFVSRASGLELMESHVQVGVLVKLHPNRWSTTVESWLFSHKLLTNGFSGFDHYG
jgi:hypothetical protein